MKKLTKKFIKEVSDIVEKRLDTPIIVIDVAENEDDSSALVFRTRVIGGPGPADPPSLRVDLNILDGETPQEVVDELSNILSKVRIDHY
jgi:hypothetical protein